MASGGWWRLLLLEGLASLDAAYQEPHCKASSVDVALDAAFSLPSQNAAWSTVLGAEDVLSDSQSSTTSDAEGPDCRCLWLL